ncbi:MAG: HD domain-containing protein [Candidatus Omnitrophica bacterium]|nr:HD domain-containing protein [Candidatus Omnitrophota bacterium]MBD3268989.1 HD domain-containing protein [Candidatus Omnitrophota bacterium]
MKKKKEDLECILDFIFEAGLLKRCRRSGWSVLGIEPCESVADHSFRCAVIGYILAKTEKADANKVVLMGLFNDIHEARISDLHKMAQNYIDEPEVSLKAFKEQVKKLPSGLKKELNDLRKEYIAQTSIESLIARDADILECLIQAKEYREEGWLHADEFMKKAPAFLKTPSARRVWKAARGADPSRWWFKLSKFLR